MLTTANSHGRRRVFRQAEYVFPPSNQYQFPHTPTLHQTIKLTYPATSPRPPQQHPRRRRINAQPTSTTHDTTLLHNPSEERAIKQTSIHQSTTHRIPPTCACALCPNSTERLVSWTRRVQCFGLVRSRGEKPFQLRNEGAGRGEEEQAQDIPCASSVAELGIS
jgi:hypothetical protein